MTLSGVNNRRQNNKSIRKPFLFDPKVEASYCAFTVPLAPAIATLSPSPPTPMVVTVAVTPVALPASIRTRSTYQGQIVAPLNIPHECSAPSLTRKNMWFRGRCRAACIFDNDVR